MQFTVALASLALLLPIVASAPSASAGTPIPRLQPLKVTPKKAAPTPTSNKGGDVFKGNNGSKSGNQAGSKTGTNNAATNNNGNNGGNNNNNNGGGNDVLSQAATQAASLDANALQSSLTLSPNLVQPGSGRTGQEDPTPGQVDSDVSFNNFINHCATVPNLALTNGEQNFEGSCNGIIMGEIMAKDKMPSSKIIFPLNNDVIAEGQDINFQIAQVNMVTGHFTNAQLTYYAAPQRLDGTGTLIGHNHVTVNTIDSLQDTTPLDPQDFVFFKGLNDAAVNGVLNATAVGGLKAGTYRVCSLSSSSNHTPVIPPVAQRASGDDCTRFAVVPAAQIGGFNPAGGNNLLAGGADAISGLGISIGGGKAPAGGNNNNNNNNQGNNGAQGNNNANANGQGNANANGGQNANAGGNKNGKKGKKFGGNNRRSFTPASRSRVQRK